MATSKPEKLLWDSPEFSKMYKAAEKFTGGYAQMLLQQANFEKDANSGQKLDILDMACGTGVVSSKVMDMLGENSKAKLELTCADFADSMVASITERIRMEGWTEAKAIKADAQDTKLPSSKYSHIFFNFGPMLLPNPRAGMDECFRMLQPNGTLGISTWEQVGWTADVRAGFATNPDLPALPSDDELMSKFSDSGERWDSPDKVEKYLKAHGFVDVRVTSAPRTTRIEHVDEFVRTIPGTLGVIFQKFWTAEQCANHVEQAKDTVVRYMRQKYGDGGFDWHWVAILATAKKPQA